MLTYTTWNYICTISFYSLLFEPFWFEFSVICSQRQSDKYEPRIKPTFIVRVHLSAHPSPPKAAFTALAPVDSTQHEAGVRKEETRHPQGKDLFRGLRGEERMCMLTREGQAAQLTSKWCWFLWNVQHCFTSFKNVGEVNIFGYYVTNSEVHVCS